MRKLLLAAVGAVAMSATSMASAAIVVGAPGTFGSTTGSTVVIANLDNSTFPETFQFDTIISDQGANSPYMSYFQFSNDLRGFYNFSITTAVLGATVTLEQVLDNGTLTLVPGAQSTGSSSTLALLTPILDAGTTYRFTYTSTSPSNGKISGNAAFYPVPEPTTWAMMLVGFAGIGMAMRRRRQPALAQLA